ncbi:MAG: twin-arginine translocase TatA/TatE family subunit [Alphaproteobacteria bacterium]
MAPGMLQIAVVILLVMVLFGAGRIPTIMENLAKGINSFKKGLKDEGDASDSLKNDTKNDKEA